MYNYISGLRTDSYVLFHPRSNIDSVPSSKRYLTRLTPRGHDRKRRHQPTPHFPTPKPPTHPSRYVPPISPASTPLFAWKKTTTTFPPPPLPAIPTPPPQTNPRSSYIIRCPWPVPWTHAGYKPRHHAPSSEPSLVRPSPVGRVGGFGFRLSARVCRRVYLAFGISGFFVVKSSSKTVEIGEGRKASKQLNRMRGGGGLRAGLHDEDNEDEGPLLVMLGRVSFRGIGMVDGGCFFYPADGYQPLRADFHRAESQSRVVSWC